MQQKQQRGFTILEVLITVIIVATASATLLGQIRGLMDLNKRMRKHQNIATELLNQAAELSQQEIEYQIINQTAESIILQPPQKDYTVKLNNFSTTAKTVSISQAYTPYQQYQLKQQNYKLTFIQPGISNHE